jgi:hypothetical protein
VGRHEVEWHDTGAMHWTWPITLKVGIPGALILGAGLLLTSPVPVLIGGLALVVAGCGRIGSSIIERYAGRPLAQPPAAPFAGRRRRRSARRLSGFPVGVTVFAVAIAALLIAAGTTVAERCGVVAAALAIAVPCYLTGPAARFVVDPVHLHVDTAFRRISLPRRLLSRFDADDLSVRVTLTDDDHYDVRVDSPLLDWAVDYRSNHRAQVRTAARLARLLADVPAAPDAGTAVTTSRRYLPAVAAGLGLLAVVALAGAAFLA